MRINKARMSEPVNEHYTLGEELAHSVTHGVGASHSSGAPARMAANGSVTAGSSS